MCKLSKLQLKKTTIRVLVQITAPLHLTILIFHCVRARTFALGLCVVYAMPP